MEGSLVETNSVLAPGTVLPPGRLIPSGQLWAGNPAHYVRDLSKDEVSVWLIYACLSEGNPRFDHALVGQHQPHTSAYQWP